MAAAGINNIIPPQAWEKCTLKQNKKLQNFKANFYG